MLALPWFVPSGHCTTCDVAWTGDAPCWMCHPHPAERTYPFEGDLR